MIDTNALRKKVIDLAVAGKLNEHINSKANDELDCIKKSLGNTCSRNISIEEKWTVIPENWTWARLADITTNESLNDGNWVLSDDMVSEGEVKLIQLGSIGDCEYKYKGFKYLTKEHFRELNGKQIYPGYLLINRLVVDKMMTCLIPDLEGILMTAVDVCWVAPNDGLYNIEYLMYAMSSSGVQQRVKELGHGVTRFRISKLNLIDIAFPLPPFEEQKTIVEKINEYLSLLNCIDTLQEKYNSDFEVLKNKIIDAGIRGKLTEQLPEEGNAEELYKQIQEEKAKLIKEGKIKKEKSLPVISDEEIPFEIPSNWKWVRLGEISKIITKGSSPKWQGVSYTSEENGVLFITSENVGDGQLIIDKKKFVERKFNDMHPTSMLKKGDILTNIVGASIGRTTVFNLECTDANINQAVCVVRLVDQTMTQYIEMYLCGSIAIKFMMGKVVDTARANLSLTSITNLLIPLPPLEEQKRIVSKIELLFGFLIS